MSNTTFKRSISANQIGKTPAPIAFTASKFAKLKSDLEAFQLERKQILVRLQTAREMGDLSENGAYTYAKKELGDIDRRIRQTQYFLKYGQVIEPIAHTDEVALGHQVTLSTNGKTQQFTIIGTQEADPLAGQISNVSPLGKALLGKKVGQTVTVSTPRGETNYTIEAIEVATSV